MSHRISALAALALATALPGWVAAQPTESVWEASSGRLPTEVCPAWTLVDTAAGADPVLVAEGLKLVTAAGEDMLFMQTLDPVGPDPLVAEAHMRFVSGSSIVTNRAPGAIVVTVASNLGVFFGIGADEIFLTTSGDVRGTSATVDTDEAAHTYRIEVTGGGAVTVFYDGVSTLTGITYTNAEAFGGERRLLWGEGPIQASGSLIWESFKHNAASCSSGTTTTTTLPPASCDRDVPGSLGALLCRLDILAARMDQMNVPGPFRVKLRSSLDRANARTREAMAACTVGDPGSATRRTKQVGKLLRKMAHQLKGPPARKQLDPIVRADLLEVIASLRTDVTGLRRNACANQ